MFLEKLAKEPSLYKRKIGDNASVPYKAIAIQQHQ